MKKIMLFFVLISLLSCKNADYKSDLTTLDYNDIEHLKIDYNEMFLMQNPSYFVYFYQLNCLHCILLKQNIITYALSGKVKTYFIQCDERINIIDDTATTIGCSDITSFGILGTPTLILIQEGEVAINVAGEDLIKTILNEYN